MSCHSAAGSLPRIGHRYVADPVLPAMQPVCALAVLFPNALAFRIRRTRQARGRAAFHRAVIGPLETGLPDRSAFEMRRTRSTFDWSTGKVLVFMGCLSGSST